MKTGFIFDFDGVLASTMEAHFKCNEKALAEAGIPIDKKQFLYQAGMTGREQIAYFAAKAGVEADIESIYRRKHEIYEEFIGNVTVIECNLKLLRALRAAGFPVAIATGSSYKSTGPVLVRYGIEADALVTSADVANGKPNPDIFLTAAERLGVPPEDCIVFEDADVGIEAAKRAGMRSMRFFDLPPAL